MLLQHRLHLSSLITSICLTLRLRRRNVVAMGQLEEQQNVSLKPQPCRSARSSGLRELKNTGQGAWQHRSSSAAVNCSTKAWTCFTDKFDANTDDEIIKRLAAGRRRAAGLPGEEKEEDPQEDNAEQQKPN